MRLTRFLALLVASVALASAGGSAVSYRLAPGSVELGVVQEVSEGAYAVALQLTQNCSTEFRELTSRHMGELLTLVFSPEIELTTVVKARVYSGEMQLSIAESEAEAQRRLQEVMEHAGPTGLPVTGPCLVRLS